jgi:hypothetical protein
LVLRFDIAHGLRLDRPRCGIGFPCVHLSIMERASNSASSRVP